jgi:hypothetical protein
MTARLPPMIVTCPALACAACDAEVGCERVTEQTWAWVHATAQVGCPGLVIPATSVVYLLHLLPAYRHARHYLGTSASSGSLTARLRDHALGRGARLLQVALGAGCRFELVRLWPGSREDERRLKNQRAVPRLLCPVCPSRTPAHHQLEDRKDGAA